jgi:lipoate-protein ligase A
VVEDRVGEAADLHAAWPSVARRPDLARAAVCRVTAPAVVLGSTQADDVVDAERAAAAGVVVARRRSGGGAVLVTPDDPVWVDVWVPAGHPLWCSDVGQAFGWLGDAWVEALASVGITNLSTHRKGFVACTRWSSLVCFGGVGAGEVITDDGRKIVGLAQRRNRDGAWFHGACVLEWDPSTLVDVLAMSTEERMAAVAGLDAAVIGAADLCRMAGRPPVDGAVIASALIDALP